jgi:hypothetical protein
MKRHRGAVMGGVLVLLLSGCAPGAGADGGTGSPSATIEGPLAFTVGSAGIASGAVLLWREASGAADYCARKETPTFRSLGIIGLTGKTGTFTVIPGAPSSANVNVGIFERAPGKADVMLVAESGTVTLTAFPSTAPSRVTGSLSVQFPLESARTTATFDFEPCTPTP